MLHDAGQLAARTRGRQKAERRFRAVLNHLRAFTVVDPACDSGNFLYLAVAQPWSLSREGRGRV